MNCCYCNFVCVCVTVVGVSMSNQNSFATKASLQHTIPNIHWKVKVIQGSTNSIHYKINKNSTFQVSWRMQKIISTIDCGVWYNFRPALYSISHFFVRLKDFGWIFFFVLSVISTMIQINLWFIIITNSIDMKGKNKTTKRKRNKRKWKTTSNDVQLTRQNNANSRNRGEWIKKTIRWMMTMNRSIIYYGNASAK